MHIPSEQLNHLRDLYEAGRYLTAYQQAQAIAPLHEWRGTAARLLAGRLAMQVGGIRLGRLMHIRAFRADPEDLEAAYYFARYKLDSEGPLAILLFARKRSDFIDASSEYRADWFGLLGFVAARLHDFERADAYHTRAEKLAGDRPWIWVERAASLEMQERFDEAYDAAQRSLQLHRDFRPGLQSLAHNLDRLGRGDEAIDLLRDAMERVESGLIAGQLAGLLAERGCYADARRWFERQVELSPLLDKLTKPWLTARRADIAYYCGDWATARELALQVGDPFYTEFASRLNGEPPAEEPTSPPNCVLPTAYVPPTGLLGTPTGAAGTLGLLCRFYDKTGPNPESVSFDPVCPDGLLNPQERQWLQANNFVTQAFTLTAERAYALLERGLPFLLYTIDSGYAHTRVAFGFERRRGVIWAVSDAERYPHEVVLSVMIERFKGIGPIGLVAVPQEQAERLNGLNFADAAAYDLAHEFQVALSASDRDRAGRIVEELHQKYPQHLLSLQARLALARFDGHPEETLAAIRAIEAIYPEEVTYQLAKAVVLRDHGPREIREKHFREQCAQKNAEPIFLQQYAQACLHDIDRFPMARRMLKRACRLRPFSAGNYYILGNLLWEMRQFEDAVELYRVAAALDEHDEGLAQVYFRSARMIDMTTEAARFLQSRFQRNSSKNASYARVLYSALAERDAFPEAFAVLDRAMKLRPEDPDLLLFAAEAHAEHGRHAQATRLLETARPFATRTRWLRTAAQLALLQLRFDEALTHWREVLNHEPTALDAHRNFCRLLADSEGRPAVLRHLAATVQRFPHSHPLALLQLDWLRLEGAAACEQPLQRMIARCPQDANAHRELALVYAETQRFEAAEQQLREAAKLDSTSAIHLFVAGKVMARAGRTDEARSMLRSSLRQNVDSEATIAELLALCSTKEERLAELELLEEELVRQPTTGEGVLAFRENALREMEIDKVQTSLENIRDANMQVGIAWSLLAQHLAMTGQLEDALDLARRGTERFPLMGRLWYDLAEIYGLQGEIAEQIEHLKLALQTSPNWSPAARELSEVLQQDDQSEEAFKVLESALVRSPLDAVNHGYMAEALWNRGEAEQAMAALKRALKLDPGYEWAWRAMADWSERMDEPTQPAEWARELTRLRRGDPRTWLALARTLYSPQHAAEALNALEHALELAPQNIEACDLKGERLAEMGRFDEAIAACRPAGWVGELPMVLQGRIAWIEAKRGNYSAAIPPMQKLVAVEPHYYWGWQQLAEWYNETGRVKNFLEAAGELVRLRPENPVALATRGEAKLKSGDRDGGKDDLRRAQQIAPNYPMAGIKLFDAYLEDEEFDSAAATLAILQEHVGDVFVMARQVRLAACQNDQQSALETLEQIALTYSESAWPLHMASQACREAGWSQEVDDTLKKVWQGDEPFHPVTAIFWVDSPSGQRASDEEKLKALDAGIATKPDFPQTYDYKAETLARLKRLKEAREVCRPPAFGADIPLMLQGREAWLKAVEGDRVNAIAQMEEIVAKSPSYYWGWQQLYHWYTAEGQDAAALQATERLVRLSQGEPSALYQRGEARAKSGDRKGAKEDYRAAFEADPSFVPAGLELFDEQLQAGELAEAENTLKTISKVANGPWVQFKAIQLAIRRNDKNEAINQLRNFLTNPETPPHLAPQSVESLRAVGWGMQVNQLLTELIEDPAAIGVVGRLWAVQQAGQGNDLSVYLPNLIGGNEAKQEAIAFTMECMCAKRFAPRLKMLIAEFGPRLAESTRVWAAVGMALTGARLFAEGVNWMSDWKKRSDVMPVYLINLVLCLRSLNRFAEAHKTSQAALALEQADYTIPFHRVWLALDAALEGDVAACEEQLLVVGFREELDDYHRLIHSMAFALLSVAKERPGKRKRAFSIAKRQLTDTIALNQNLDPDPALLVAYKATVASLAKLTGGLTAHLWATWKTWFPEVTDAERPGKSGPRGG